MHAQIAPFLNVMVEFLKLSAFYSAFGFFLTKKRPPLIIVMTVLLTAGLAVVLLAGFVSGNRFFAILFSNAFIFGITFFYGGKLPHKLVIFAVCGVFMTVSELTVFIVFRLSERLYGFITTPSFEIYNIIIDTCSIPVFWLTMKFIAVKIKKSDNNIGLKRSIAVISIPILLITYINAAYITYRIYDYGSPFSNNELLIAVAAIILISISALFPLQNFLEKFELKHRTACLDSEIKNQQLNFEKTSAFFRGIAKMEHDNKNHLRYIKACIIDNRTEESLNYIEKILQNGAERITIVNTGNLLIDTLLSNAIEVAKKHNTELDYAADISGGDIAVETYDLCAVLGNALDNAIEACKKVPPPEKRRIMVKINLNKKELIIKIKNSTDGNIKMGNGRFLSGKGNKIAHSIGLDSIEAIADKYGGEMVTKLNGRTFYFAVLLPFKAEYANSI